MGSCLPCSCITAFPYMALFLHSMALNRCCTGSCIPRCFCSCGTSLLSFPGIKIGDSVKGRSTGTKTMWYKRYCAAAVWKHTVEKHGPWRGIEKQLYKNKADMSPQDPQLTSTSLWWMWTPNRFGSYWGTSQILENKRENNSGVCLQVHQREQTSGTV